MDHDPTIEQQERVQKRFRRTLTGLECLSFRERLNRLGQFSLKCRRLRSDLIEVYKIMRGMDKENSQGLFPRPLRGGGGFQPEVFCGRTGSAQAGMAAKRKAEIFVPAEESDQLLIRP
eukprot:g37956.t1